MSNILLIHGAWGGAWEFEDIVKILNERGHQARAIDLPGHGHAVAPIAEVTMDAYVARVAEEVSAIDGKVVLVGHSLAGSIVSQVAELAPEKIERLVYVCAILPRNGETPLGLMQSDEAGELLSRIVFSDDGSCATLREDDVRAILLHDVREAGRVDEFAPLFAVKQAVEPFTVPARLTRAAFGSVPKSYLRCSLDKVLSPALQDRMVSGTDVDRILTLESGHFPLMSIPERLVEALAEAASGTLVSM